MNADGTGQTMISNDGQLPNWSPDGTKIAFVRQSSLGGEPSFEMFTMNPDGSGERNITPFGGLRQPFQPGRRTAQESCSPPTPT